MSEVRAGQLWMYDVAKVQRDVWYIVMPLEDVTTERDSASGYRVWRSLFVDGRGHGRDEAGDVVINYWPTSCWRLLQDVS